MKRYSKKSQPYILFLNTVKENILLRDVTTVVGSTKHVYIYTSHIIWKDMTVFLSLYSLIIQIYTFGLLVWEY